MRDPIPARVKLAAKIRFLSTIYLNFPCLNLKNTSRDSTKVEQQNLRISIEKLIVFK